MIINEKQMYYLNAIRYVSCILVFTGHFFETFIYRLLGDPLHSLSPLFVMLFDLHAFGVMVFFVLSGFLITYSTFISGNTFQLIKYIEKRCYRIFPPLWFALIFSGVIFLVIKYLHLFGSVSYVLPGDLYSIRSKALMPLKEVLCNFLLIPGLTGGFNGALWSLSYEFFYYILFAASMVFILQKRFIIGSVLFLTVAMIIMSFIHICPKYQVEFSHILELFLVWLMGCSIACIFIKADMMTFRKLCVVLFLISTVFVYTMGLKLILAQSFHRYITYGVLASFLIVYFLSMNWIPKWIKYLSYGSRYTYTLYLLHFPAFLFSLSLLGKYLLNFHWYNYLFLYLTFRTKTYRIFN